jgi:ligand-binding SRPBCC domain-containing protein
MTSACSLQFESTLNASRESVWNWITSVEGIGAEMRPIMRMTMPRSMRHLPVEAVQPGQRLFRSYLLLFGVLPVDWSDLTLIEIAMGSGFVELSPMASMKLWRHERRIVELPQSTQVLLIDHLSFQPRWAASLVRWFVRRLFEHRHAVLRAHFC